MKPPIVLLTDYGYQDPYGGILRGVIASSAPQIPVIDLTHGVLPQNIRQASVYLESSYRYFPSGSIFVCVVDPGVGTSRSILCVKSKSYFFLAPDNGLLTELADVEPLIQIRRLENKNYFLTPNPSATFHGRDIFASVAAALAKNPDIFSKLGPKLKTFHRLEPVFFQKSKKKIQGSVIYFDHFGNAVTNIKRFMMPASFWKSAQVTADRYKTGLIQPTYGSNTKMIALFNSANRLELSLPGASAASLLKTNSKIQVSL